MKRSNGVVVDADVARASSDRSEAPRAVACARALASIHASEALYVVLEERLREEWRTHQSAFTRRWLYSMYARRRVRAHASVPAWETLRSAIESLPPRARAAAEKDLHLVELARHDGWKIVSLDGTARRAFIQTCGGCVDLKQLAWADPTLADTLHWLADGARKTGPCLGDDLPTQPPSRAKPSITRRSSARRRA